MSGMPFSDLDAPVDLTEPVPATANGPDPTRSEPKGHLSASISNAVVKLFADFVGRGPTKARTVMGRDLVTVVLQDTFTKAEQHLLERGAAETVLSMRRTIQATMREELVAAVEELTGRKVIAFLSDHQADPDFAVESFVLEPDPRAGPADDSGLETGTRNGEFE